MFWYTGYVGNLSFGPVTRTETVRALSSMHLSDVWIMLMSCNCLIKSERGLYLSRLLYSSELELIWTIYFLYICVLVF